MDDFMSITVKPIALSDGRILYHHAIIEQSLDIETTTLTITVGSWESQDREQSGEKPALITSLPVKYESWTESHLDSAIDTVLGHPEWTLSGPAKPSELHRWNPVTLVWVAPQAIPLDDIKLTKWTAIKAAREAAIDAQLVTPYGTVDSKAKDRTNITDAVLMLQTMQAIGTSTTIDFTMADNSTVTLTTEQMVTVGLLLGQKVQAAHSRARVLRAAIDTATSPQGVEEITW